MTTIPVVALEDEEGVDVRSGGGKGEDGWSVSEVRRELGRNKCAGNLESSGEWGRSMTERRWEMLVMRVATRSCENMGGRSVEDRGCVIEGKNGKRDEVEGDESEDGEETEQEVVAGKNGGWQGG